MLLHKSQSHVDDPRPDGDLVGGVGAAIGATADAVIDDDSSAVVVVVLPPPPPLPRLLYLSDLVP